MAMTSIIPKVIERVLNNRLLATTDLLGFPLTLCTGDFHEYTIHFYSEAIELCALAVCLEISKTFDRVRHGRIMFPSHGIAIGLCNWIADLLRDRSICVFVDVFVS